MGPGTDQTRALVVQRGHLDLQHPFAGGGAIAENLEDQTGTVKQFDAPCFFKVALLDRRHWSIDQHQFNLGLFKDKPKLLDLARAEQHARADGAQGHNIGPFHVQMRQGTGQGDGFRQGGLRDAAVIV